MYKTPACSKNINKTRFSNDKRLLTTIDSMVLMTSRWIKSIIDNEFPMIKYIYEEQPSPHFIFFSDMKKLLSTINKKAKALELNEYLKQRLMENAYINFTGENPFWIEDGKLTSILAQPIGTYTSTMHKINFGEIKKNLDL